MAKGFSVENRGVFYKTGKHNDLNGYDLFVARFSPWEVDALIGSLDSLPNAQKKAVFTALQEAGRQARNEVLRRIAARYAVRKKYAERYVTYGVSPISDILFLKVIGPKVQNISEFKGAQTKKGWRPKILRGAKAKPIANSFMGVGAGSGKAIVFQRTGAARPKLRGQGMTKGAPPYPIKAVYTTAGLEFLLREEETEGIKTFLQQAFLRRLRYRVERELSKIGGK